jgi:hypothetical protein
LLTHYSRINTHALHRHWQNDRVGAYRGLVNVAAHSPDDNKRFVPRVTYREVTWVALSAFSGENAAFRHLVAVFSTELDAPGNSSLTSNPRNFSDAVEPLDVIPMCSRTFPPFVTGLCFEAPLVYADYSVCSFIINSHCD